MPTLAAARRLVGSFAVFFALVAISQTALAFDAPVTARVVSPVVDRDSVRLTGNTHPLATPDADRGLVDPTQRLERMMLVLQRSPLQDLALAAFNERQHDQHSLDYHHWLGARDFGRLYGPADADITAVTQWLERHGFEIYQVNEGKVSIEFSGTVAQVQEAFQVQMHRYRVNAVEHIANDRDPQIPRALAPVVNGVASLNDFRPVSLTILGKTVRRDMKTGKVTPLPPASVLRNPDFGYEGPEELPHEDVSPYDFATIYNSLPLWKASTPIIGTGVTIAIAGGSDIAFSDVAAFRQAFGLPVKSFITVHNGTDPGESGPNGDQIENTLDVEMAGAAAPGASITLVVSKDTSTSRGFELSMQYIVSHETAPIMSASYGVCELALGKSGNALFSSIEQQGATEGISIFVAAGDAGAAGCGDFVSGLAVNGLASSPYVSAVGGTDFTWNFLDELSTYWNTTTNADGASAKGYLPEYPWNSTCANPWLPDQIGYPDSQSLCNAAADNEAFEWLVNTSGGGGGTSTCTAPTGTSAASCTGGYAKPIWQTGTGVPADGKRDVPDLSLFSSMWAQYGVTNGSAILFCYAAASYDNSCNYADPDVILAQEVGGTSAASPYMAGVMALIEQKTGTKQGLANPTFYKLAATESLSSCDSSSVKDGNSCIFYDITSGTNAQVCTTGSADCTSDASTDPLGVQNNYSADTGYDRTTGLGSVNITNLVNAWSTASPTPLVNVSPTSLTFPSTGVGSVSAAQVLALKNTGSVAVSISNVSLTGGQADDFVLSKTCGTSLAVGASCTASVTFKPVSTGTKTASISFADNAGNSPQTVSLTGTGASSGSAAVKLSTTSLAFANQAPNTMSAAKSVTVTNSSSATLSFNSIVLSGDQTDDFALTKTCGSTLAAGTSCTITVTLTPVSTGAKTAAISIADNASGSPQTVKLTGTGSTSAGSAAVTLSAAAIAFANQTVKTTSAATTVTVTNSGSATLSFTSIALSGGQADDFALTKTCGTTLAAGASCTLSVTFTPVSTGAKTAAISLLDNASGSPQSVALNGTAVMSGSSPAVTLSPAAISFATQKAGTASAARTVTVRYGGAGTLSFTSITLMGGQVDDFLLSTTCASTLAANASCTLTVSFVPVSAGKKSASVSIADNASGSPQSVALSGTGD